MSHSPFPWRLTRRTALAGLAALGASGAIAEPIRSLASAARGSGRLYGAAAEPGPLTSDVQFADLFRRQCAVLTAENALKWNALRPSIDRYDFTGADQLVAFASTAGLKMHGHGLVWHEALPRWFADAVEGADYREGLAAFAERRRPRF